MNQHLSIKKYSQVVDSVIFMFLVYPNNDPYAKEVKRYSRRKKWIEIGLKLDYDRLLVATEKETLQMMAQLYLDAIKMYPTIRGKVRLEEFDYEVFYVDVRTLFVAQGWVEAKHKMQIIEQQNK